MALGSDSMQFTVERKKKKGDAGKGRTERPKAVSVICINQTVEDSTGKSESTDALQRKRYTEFPVIESCRSYLQFKTHISPCLPTFSLPLPGPSLCKKDLSNPV